MRENGERDGVEIRFAVKPAASTLEPQPPAPPPRRRDSYGAPFEA